MLDIASLKVFTVNNKIFFKVSIPLLTDFEWDMNRLYPIPSKKGNAFLAPLIDNPIYFLLGTTYMNVDNEYLETHCKSKIGITICKRTQPIHDRTARHDCSSELISFSNSIKICKFVVYM